MQKLPDVLVAVDPWVSNPATSHNARLVALHLLQPRMPRPRLRRPHRLRQHRAALGVPCLAVWLLA